MQSPVKLSNLTGFLRQQNQLFGLSVCRHVLPQLTAYLDGQAADWLAFPAGSTGLMLVVATVPPCRPGDGCDKDHSIRGTEAAAQLKAWIEPSRAGRLRFSRAWARMFLSREKARA